MCPYYIFRRFLDERGYADCFEEAFGIQNPGYRLDSVIWDIMGGDEYFLGRAFDWSETKEGREFWARIDSEWHSICINR